MTDTLRSAVSAVIIAAPVASRVGWGGSFERAWQTRSLFNTDFLSQVQSVLAFVAANPHRRSIAADDVSDWSGNSVTVAAVAVALRIIDRERVRA